MNQQDNQQYAIYDEFAAKHNAAFAAFKSMYEAKNPPPPKPTAARDMVSTIIILALSVVMVSSIVVSSSRTVVEFGGNLIGAMAFVMLEGGLVAYAFFRARRNASQSKIEDARRLATFGLVLAFASAIGANVDNVLKTHGLSIPQTVNTIINLLVALSAPTMAFISSDVLAIELMSGDRIKRQTEAVYQEAYSAWMESLNRAWSSQQRNWGVKVEVVSEPVRLPQTDTPALSASSVRTDSGQTDNGQTAQTGYGYNRTADGQTKVVEYLTLHPEHAELSSRKLAELVGVGHDTANKGRNAWRAMGQEG